MGCATIERERDMFSCMTVHAATVDWRPMFLASITIETITQCLNPRGIRVGLRPKSYRSLVEVRPRSDRTQSSAAVLTSEILVGLHVRSEFGQDLTTNFTLWKEYIMVIMGCMDLDYAIRQNRPTPLTGASIADQKAEFEK